MGSKVNLRVILWDDKRKNGDHLEFGNTFHVGGRGVNTAILFRVRAQVIDLKKVHEQTPKYKLQRDVRNFARTRNSSPDYIQTGEAFNVSATIAEIRVYANAYDFSKDDAAFKTSELQKLAAEAHMASTLLATLVDTD